MKILFDQGTPAPLRDYLVGHTVVTAYEKGWSMLNNGDLISQAESEFDLLITTDQNLRYQQNLTSRRLAILVLLTTNWPRLKSHTNQIKTIVDSATPGSFQEFSI